MRAFIAESREGCWPTPDQTMLLQACLFKGPPALDAWRHWIHRVDFDDIDGASYRLVPLAYHNLKTNIAEPLASRVKGIYRHTWSRNQLLFHAVSEVLKVLNEAGIHTLLLKGAALIANHYSDPGLRPMGDFDFMVKPADALKAFTILQKQGWHHIEPVPLQQIVWCSHAAKFQRPGGQELDIHWHMLPEGRQPGADEDIWRGAVEINFCGADVLCANSTDLLLHVCAHGAIGDPTPPIRWIADAWMILANPAAPVNWDRLVKLAQKRRLTLSVGCALKFLREQFGAAVPVDALELLADTPVSWVERWEYRIKSGERGVLGALPLHCVNYIRLTRYDSLWQKMTGIPVFFQRIWGIENARGLPGYVIKKAVERLGSPKPSNNERV